MQYEVSDSQGCPLKRIGEDPSKCNVVDDLCCGYGGFPSQCPLLDSTVVIRRRTNDNHNRIPAPKDDLK